MSILQAKWESEQCRIENGIFFENGEVILFDDEIADIDARVNGPTSRTTLHALLETRKDWWTIIDPLCNLTKDGLVFKAGGTSWEADGFVAVNRLGDGGLIWLAHFTDSEPFVQLEIEDTIIIAVSREYPFEYKWRIPIDQPEKLEISGGHM